MSLNKIELTNYLCQNLFTKNLVVNSEFVEQNFAKNEISYLGENKKQILFIVNNPKQDFLADEEMKLLTNLLKACKLSLEDIALVNYANHPYSYEILSEKFHSKKILMFGVSTADLDLPFAIPLFQIQKFHEQFFMPAPLLEDLSASKELKTKLWICLQKLFLSTE
jgi:hypothetical protein